MLRRDRQIRMQIHQLVDAGLFAVSFWLAYEIRSSLEFINWLNIEAASSVDNFVWLYVVLIPAAPVILEWQGFYNRSILGPRIGIWWPLLRGCVLTTIGLVLTLYFFHLIIPRIVMILFGFISFGLVYLKEEILRWYYRSRMAQSQFSRRFVLIGSGDEITRLRQELKELNEEGIEIVAELDFHETSAPELIVVLHEHSANGVIISARHTYFEQVESAIRACELEGVEAWLVADFFGTQISRANFDELFGHPLLVFRSAPEASWQGLVKQLLDFFGAVILLTLSSWVLAILALMVKLTSSGPVFFRQQRSGLNGAPFTIYKFRTMVTNAEQLQHELEAMNEMTGPVFKVTNDPRITAIGKWLRRYSLDELPQLFNVLRGEMSLVGPRPLPVDEVKRFNDLAHRRRLSVKPGLTCLWQVSGRNQISDFKDWVRLDLEYIDNWSLWLDLKILCRTIPVVFIGTGAK